MFLTLFTEVANLRVWRDSIRFYLPELIVAIVVVMQFPPSELAKSLVSFESR